MCRELPTILILVGSLFCWLMPGESSIAGERSQLPDDRPNVVIIFADDK